MGKKERINLKIGLIAIIVSVMAFVVFLPILSLYFGNWIFLMNYNLFLIISCIAAITLLISGIALVCVKRHRTSGMILVVSGILTVVFILMFELIVNIPSIFT